MTFVGHAARPFLAVGFVVQLMLVPTVQSAASPFLKEILMGRCFDQQHQQTIIDGRMEFSSSSSSCDAIVGGFMNVLESRLQTDISAADFDDAYVTRSDFSSPKDAALLWLHFLGNDASSTKNATETNPSIPVQLTDLVTPHETPGGKLLDGLVFCASGPWNNDNCNIENSNAYWSFWQAAYGTFSSKVAGKLRIVVDDPLVDVHFLQKNALFHLKPDQVTTVEFWLTSFGSGSSTGDGCSTKAVLETMDYLVNVVQFPMEALSCHEDLYELALCHSNPNAEPCLVYQLGKKKMKNYTSSSSGHLDEKPQGLSNDMSNEQFPPSQKWHEDEHFYHLDEDNGCSPFWRILGWTVIAAAVYCFCTRVMNRTEDGYHVIENGKTIEDHEPDRSSVTNTNASSGAESFFLNDAGAANFEAANRVVQ